MTPSRAARASLVATAAVAGLFACWLLATEIARRSANTGLAASIGVVRGDLWAAAAKAHAAAGDRTSLAAAREAAETALAEAPLDAATWLLLADLALRDGAAFKVRPILEMAYFSASSNLQLAPERLRLAARADVVGDEMLRDFVQRDVTSILRYRPDLKPAILDAYRVASPAARSLLVQAAGEVDPNFTFP